MWVTVVAVVIGVISTKLGVIEGADILFFEKKLNILLCDINTTLVAKVD